MILEGTNINSESIYATNQASLSLAQLIKFNSVKRKPRETTICSRHTLYQETPLPVYLGTIIHSKTRIKDVIKKVRNTGSGYYLQKYKQNTGAGNETKNLTI